MCPKLIIHLSDVSVEFENIVHSNTIAHVSNYLRLQCRVYYSVHSNSSCVTSISVEFEYILIP